MNEIIDKIKPYSNLVTTVLPLWVLITSIIVYESELVKVNDIANLQTKADSAEKDLDARIALTEIKILIYSGRALTGAEQVEYDRAKARLINLEAQRDEADEQ